SLSTLAGLPHVGGTAGRSDVERVSRTVAEVQAVLAARERAFAAHGIENMAAYRELRRAAAAGGTRGGTPGGPPGTAEVAPERGRPAGAAGDPAGGAPGDLPADPFGDAFLVVDRWGSLPAGFEDLDPPLPPRRCGRSPPAA